MKKQMMKPALCILSILATLGVLPSCNRSGPINYVGDIERSDSEAFVRNWEITQPVIMDSSSDAVAVSHCMDTSSKDQGDSMTSYADFAAAYDGSPGYTAKSLYTPFIRYPYTLKGSYFSVGDNFHIPARNSFLQPVIPAFLYATSVVKSDREQDVIFIAGANNGLKLWLNGQLILHKFSYGYIQGYQYVLKAHLKKGDNFVLAKLNHVDGEWKFFLKMASVRYANENSVGENYSGICDHYLVKMGDSLDLRICAPEIKVEKPALLRMTNIRGKEVLRLSLSPARGWKVSTQSLKEGVYAVSLTTDENVFKQYIFYGDYEKYFRSFRTMIGRGRPGGRFRENMDLLINRMGYVDTVKVWRDNEYERKVARVLYDMSDLYEHYKRGDELFKDVTGLHLRAQSSPFYASESYMVYVPGSYRRTSPIPLVMMLPHESGIREFTISTYVSDINRIEHVMRLADKYGFAVLWSSYRVYTNHNLTRMFPDVVARTLASVKGDYNIDDNRIYAYGDCAAGELALFMADKYPSFFAAVAVEGPAIPDEVKTDSLKKPTIGQINYDFYNTVENYRNFPTYIIHSINDEKSPFTKSADLYKEIKQLGGSATLDTLYIRKGADLFFVNLMPDNKIMSDVFSFYNGKRRRVPDTVWLSTYQLKYNHAFWVTMDDKVPGKKAVITAMANRTRNCINVQASNVAAFTLDVHDLGLDSSRKTEVIVNNRSYCNDFLKDGELKIGVLPSDTSHNRKTALTEGPINDFFASPFIVVKGTKGAGEEKIGWQNAIDILRKNWQEDYLRDAMPCKTDGEIGQRDAEEYNMILIGTDRDNPILNRIWQRIPLKVYGDSVRIGAKTYTGRNLSYVLIYPNPLSAGRYVLVIGSNTSRISPGVLYDLSFYGWNDYEVFDHGTLLSVGDFNNDWK